MSFFEKRKRKNDDPPRFPAWLIVLIAIGLVIVVEIIFQPVNISRSESSQIVVVTASPELDLTGTYIIEQATAMAQGTPQSGETIVATLDPLEMTATFLIQEATSAALGTPQLSSSTLDPIEMTATYIIKLATEQASTPGS